MRRSSYRRLLTISAALLAAPFAAAQRPVADDVFYQFMPIAWRDSDNDAFRYGDFDGMTASLDYLQYLGVTAIWMNPIHPSAAYHGYQHGPADQLNSWFGTQAQFVNFVQQAHARGMKVLVDQVCYGISQNSVYFNSTYSNPSSQYDTWLAFTNSQNTTYLGSTYRTWDNSLVGFIHWDLRTPAASDLVTNWSRKWLDPNGDGEFSDGIDGYRLDHVWVQYNSGPDGWGYNLDDFWTPWKAALRAVNPNVFTVVEQADWNSYGAEFLSVHDAAFTKPFEGTVRSALNSENAFGLNYAVSRELALLNSGGTYLCIIGDHDVNRLASTVGNSFVKCKLAAAIQMTQPFPPAIYMGDEIGMMGVKGTFGGDASDIPMREPFKWNAVAGPPMSNYFVRNTNAYGGRYSRDNDGRSVEEQQGVAGSLLEEYRRLIALRRSSVALRRGQYVSVRASDGAVWAFLRDAPAQQQLLVVINLKSVPVTTTLDLSAAFLPNGPTTPTDLLGGPGAAAITDANKAAYPLSLDPLSYHVFDVQLVLTPGQPAGLDGASLSNDFLAADVLATQNNATALGDNVSELDRLWARATPRGMRIAISGNLAVDASGLALLFDVSSGGQDTLDFTGITPPPTGVAELTGTRLDAGFSPDQMLWLNAFGGTVYVDQFALPAGAPATKTYRGSVAVNSGLAALAGGVNPNGLAAALDNRNTVGVTATDAAGAATADSGFELFVPWVDLGLTGPPGPIGVLAFIARPTGEVGNQMLPGLGGGVSNLGLTPDLSTISGDQFVTLDADLSLLGDLTRDGRVDERDLGEALRCWEAASCGDIDGDGRTGEADLAYLLSRWSGP
ncbi:MAG: alpha-amylase family glycosyl hydrolase [Phycisphaerae bacterium]